MKNNRRTAGVLLSLATLSLALSACSTWRNRFSRHESDVEKSATMSDAAKAAAHKENASFVTEVSFDHGSSDLDEVGKAKLDSLLRDAQSAGRIDEVKVIAWSDMEYPSKSVNALPKSQRDLADDRADNISDYINKIDKSIDVDTYNMTRRPNALARLFNTENAKIKKSLEVAGIPTTDNPDEIPAKVGKAMVLVVLK